MILVDGNSLISINKGFVVILLHVFVKVLNAQLLTTPPAMKRVSIHITQLMNMHTDTYLTFSRMEMGGNLSC